MAYTKKMTKAEARKLVEEHKAETAWFEGNMHDMWGDIIPTYDRMYDMFRNRMGFGEAETAVLIGALALAGAEIVDRDYKHIALCYAEDHGVIEYHVKGNKMIFYTTWEMEHRTIKVVVNLDTLGEESRTELRGYYKPYKGLIGGKYQANLEL